MAFDPSAYQWRQLASGTRVDTIRELDSYTKSFGERDVGELRLRFGMPLPDFVADKITEMIQPNTGEWYEVVRPNDKALVVRGQWGNPFPWGVVALVVIAVVALYAITANWEFWQGVANVAKRVTDWMGLSPAVVLTGAAFLSLVIIVSTSGD